MKKKTFSLTSLFALLFGLSFGLASCSDNDLDASGGKGTDGIETAEQAEKYDALLRLLSAVADADSLPDNWNADGFTMEPTIGVAESEGNKFVRLVSTRNAEEADREFRCMIGDAITGKATDSEWTKEGIGTLKFKVQNQSDLYATIDVDVKQLPHLTQIRFVPASAIGNNGWLIKVKKAYYQFGDVIKQTINGADTYWVCVRPCSVEENLGKSHWCTFQLQPSGVSDANYKDINSMLTLPTNLSSKEASGQKMTQNFFNVLRVIANPTTYKGASGIDDITTKEFGYDDARNISNLWKINDIWDKVYPSDLADAVGDKNSELSAYYYGYNTVFWGKGNYRMYRLDMKSNENSMFNTATPTNPWVLKTTELDYESRKKVSLICENCKGNQEQKDYQTLNVTLPYSEEGADKVQDNGPDLQFIVKYRTGAELEDSWTSDDKDPSQSFSVRSGKNHITDVLVSKDKFIEDNSYEKTKEPFFCVGDEVYLTENFQGNQFCVKEANPNYSLTSEIERNKTFFVCSSEGKLVENAINEGVAVSKEMAATIMYYMLASYVNGIKIYKGEKDEYDVDYRKLPNLIVNEKDMSCISGIHGTLNYAVLSDDKSKVDYRIIDKTDDKNTPITIKANINSTSYVLEYNKLTGKSEISTSNDLIEGQNKIRVYSYDETHTYKESYSLKNKLVSSENRTRMKKNAVGYVNTFLKNCTFK